MNGFKSGLKKEALPLNVAIEINHGMLGHALNKKGKIESLGNLYCKSPFREVEFSKLRLADDALVFNPESTLRVEFACVSEKLETVL